MKLVSLRGQEIVGKLVEVAVAEIKVQNKKVATTCPYVQKRIEVNVEIEPLFEEKLYLVMGDDQIPAGFKLY